MLGTPRIEVDGEALGVDTRKATALLAYLAVTGGVHGRDLLVDLLWPDSEPDRGRAALRRTLSTLRSALGGRWLDAGRAAVGLELEDDAIDVRRFRALVASAGGGTAGIRPLTTAVMLHRDDLLAGFGLRDSVAFDDWQRAAAGTLRGELEIALDRLVGALAEAGPRGRGDRPLPAAAGARPAARAGAPRADPAVRGQRPPRGGAEPVPRSASACSTASSACARCPRPASCTTPSTKARPSSGRLRRAPTTCRSTRPTGRWSAGPASGPCSREQRALCRDGGRLVVVEGEPGVGKTRLAAELLGAVRAEGGVAVEARSHDGEAALPLGLVAAVLRAALEARGGAQLAAVPDHWRGEAARLVPEVGGVAVAGEDDVAAQQRLHEGLTQVLCALLAGDPPGLLLLDDLQYADPASLAVIGYLARRLGGTPVLVVVCWRPEETSADHAPLRRLAGHALRLPRLRRDGRGGACRRRGPRPARRAPVRRDRGSAAVRGRVSGGAGGPGSRRAPRRRPRAAGRPAGRGRRGGGAAAGGGGGDRPLVRRRHAAGRQRPRRGRDGDRPRGADPARPDRRARVRLRLLARQAARPGLRAGEPGAQAAAAPPGGRRAGRPAGRCGAGRPPPAPGRSRRRGGRGVSRPRATGHGRCMPPARRSTPTGRRSPSATSSAATWTRRSATCTRCAASTARPFRRTRRRRRWPIRRGWPRSSTSWAACTTGAAIPSSPSGISPRRCALAASPPASRPTAAWSPIGWAGTRTRRSSPASRFSWRGVGEDAEAVAQAENILGMLTGDRGHLERSVELAESLPDRSVLVAALNNLALAYGQRRPGAGDRADRPGARAVLGAGRPPPRGRAAQQPGRSAAPHGPGSASRWTTSSGRSRSSPRWATRPAACSPRCGSWSNGEMMGRVSEGQIDVTGGSVWYRTYGEGDATPVLLLHGGPGAASDYMQPLAERLGEHRPAIVYDQLGCGRSDHPDDDSLWTVDRSVAEVDQVREALGLDRCHLLGQSWGGWLAIDYMCRSAVGDRAAGAGQHLVEHPAVHGRGPQADRGDARAAREHADRARRPRGSTTTRTTWRPSTSSTTCTSAGPTRGPTRLCAAPTRWRATASTW